MPPMKEAFLASVLCIALLIVSTYALSRSATNVSEHPFPMAQGIYWNYQGLVRWTHDINRVSETKVTWHTEISRFIQRADVRAAVVNGFPSDLDWSNGRPHPSDSLIIESGGRFYIVANERFTDALHQVEQPLGDLSNLLRDDDLFLRWPLQRGQKFCDSEGMARPDDWYCWVVESSRLSILQGITGVSSRKRPEFVIAYRTNPDHIRFTFVPEIGLTTYEYRHHGTVADTELRLVEFHQPSPGED